MNTEFEKSQQRLQSSLVKLEKSVESKSGGRGQPSTSLNEVKRLQLQLANTKELLKQERSRIDGGKTAPKISNQSVGELDEVATELMRLKSVFTQAVNHA